MVSCHWKIEKETSCEQMASALIFVVWIGRDHQLQHDSYYYPSLHYCEYFGNVVEF